MSEVSAFANRLAKNARARFKWAKTEGLTAFRLYDLDMPEFPFAIDWYDRRVAVHEYPRRKALRQGTAESLREEVVAACERVLEVKRVDVFVKTHARHVPGESQYERLDKAGVTFTVMENGLVFEVNLSDFLDTGLFMDHRETRKRVRAESSGLRVLNLFAYTGSFSVYAAAGHAVSTTTVDLSGNYCDWAERNLRLNGFTPGKQHEVIRADVLQWIDQARGQWDLIVCDPPSFSTSKKMTRGFDVQRDHTALINACGDLLSPSGTLYFSTNLVGFELDPLLRFREELTPESIPVDFRRTVHRCWRF
jgi:23S rRNA (cytosine1962-C5)-methyltransferase